MSYGDAPSWSDAVEYFTGKGALNKFDNDEHEELQNEYDFYSSLMRQSSAEGRFPLGILERQGEVAEEMVKKGHRVY